MILPRKTKWKRGEFYIAFSYCSNKSKSGNRKFDCYVKLVLSPVLFFNNITYLKIIKSISQINRVYMIQSMFKHVCLYDYIIHITVFNNSDFLRALEIFKTTIFRYLYNCDGHKRVQSNSECKRQTNRFLKTRKYSVQLFITLLILVIVRLTSIPRNF